MKLRTSRPRSPTSAMTMTSAAVPRVSMQSKERLPDRDRGGARTGNHTIARLHAGGVSERHRLHHAVAEADDLHRKARAGIDGDDVAHRADTDAWTARLDQ